MSAFDFRLMLGPLTLTVLASVVTPSMGAEIAFVSNQYSPERFVPHIHYSGPVVEGDAQKLIALLDEKAKCDVSLLPTEGGNCAVVTLQSPGGNYVEGLKLARLFRERAFTTVVEVNSECYPRAPLHFWGAPDIRVRMGSASTMIELWSRAVYWAFTRHILPRTI